MPYQTAISKLQIFSSWQYMACTKAAKQGTNEYKRKTEQIWALVCTIYEFVLHFILQATRQKSDEQIAFKNSHQHEKK